MPLARRRLLIGNRAHQRFPTTFPARLQQAGHLIDVEVVDISIRGARIRPHATIIRLAVGLRMTLMADGLLVDGEVTRRVDDEYGLHFDRDIEPLKAVRANYRAPPAPRAATRSNPSEQ
ncbi:PilZ domain-containing protein [Sphingomonas sp. CLY1604]|uniref:PilZ domain-containing protein n=1 Tax=Sphingomonas sp. CLY1604 TaxID=3457786 RepID=UPI003FD7A260